MLVSAFAQIAIFMRLNKGFHWYGQSSLTLKAHGADGFEMGCREEPLSGLQISTYDKHLPESAQGHLPTV